MSLGPNELLLSLTSATQAVRVEETGAPRPWAWSLSEDVEVWRNHPDADQVIWIIGGILRAPLAPGVDRVELLYALGAPVPAHVSGRVWIAAVPDGPAFAKCGVVWSMRGRARPVGPRSSQSRRMARQRMGDRRVDLLRPPGSDSRWGMRR